MKTPGGAGESKLLRRRLMALQSGTVDNLLRYYMGVVFIWDERVRLDGLVADSKRTKGEERARAQALVTARARLLHKHVVRIRRIEGALLEQMTAVAALPDP